MNTPVESVFWKYTIPAVEAARFTDLLALATKLGIGSSAGVVWGTVMLDHFGDKRTEITNDDGPVEITLNSIETIKLFESIAIFAPAAVGPMGVHVPTEFPELWRQWTDHMKASGVPVE